MTFINEEKTPCNTFARIYATLPFRLFWGQQRGGGYAANIDTVSYTALVERAERKQYVRVMVNLDIDVPLSQATDRKLQGKINALADQVLAELGSHALKTTVWNNGLGQIGVHVTPAGLAILTESGHIRGFDRDVTDGSRDTAYDSHGRLAAIEEEIERNGYADIELALNLENFDYEIGPGGRAVFKTSSVQRTEAAAKLTALLDSLPASGVHGLAQARADATKEEDAEPVRVLRVSKEGFYILKEHKGIRSLRLANRDDEAATYLDPDALSSAQAHGEAIVTIDLHRVPGYTPQLDYLPQKARRTQIDSIRNAYLDIVLQIGTADAKLISEYPGIASATFRLTAQGLEKLYKNPDPRIAGVHLEKTVLRPALAQSTVQLNLPQAWQKGYKAAGQYIAILDTGVDKNHPFFLNAAGTQSRVAYEACYGTTVGIEYKTYCPNPNGAGDSPFLAPGSAAPCTFTSLCDHGTHVAGIAAGRLGWNGLSGVAPEASIIAVNVFSQRNTNELVGLTDDFTAALQAIYDSGLTEVTVNMSFGDGEPRGSLFWIGGCVTSSSLASWLPVRDLVLLLKSRNIPVVAATGNQGSRGGINFPACVQEVIKVAAITDDATNPTLYADSNVANPEIYTGGFFLAPGDLITSSVPGGGTDSKPGTSMATPHVAGLYAAVKAANPGVSVTAITGYLWGNGVEMSIPTDSGNKPFRRVRIPNL